MNALPIIAFLLLLCFMALMLYRVDRRKPEKPLVLCAYCPDMAGRSKAALKAHRGRTITRGICRSCKERILK